MPSHQERIRRSYTTTTLIENNDIRTGDQIITIKITQLDLIRWPSKRSMFFNIHRLILEAFLRSYKE